MVSLNGQEGQESNPIEVTQHEDLPYSALSLATQPPPVKWSTFLPLCWCNGSWNSAQTII